MFSQQNPIEKLIFENQVTADTPILVLPFIYCSSIFICRACKLRALVPATVLSPGALAVRKADKPLSLWA